LTASEGPDRSSDCSVDIDDSVRDACVGPQARHPVEKRAAIGLILGGEGGHSDRRRIRHLLIDRVEIPVLERPQRDVHLGDPKRVIAWRFQRVACASARECPLTLRRGPDDDS
jgi:hypothetical protein